MQYTRKMIKKYVWVIFVNFSRQNVNNMEIQKGCKRVTFPFSFEDTSTDARVRPLGKQPPNISHPKAEVNRRNVKNA